MQEKSNFSCISGKSALKFPPKQKAGGLLNIPHSKFHIIRTRSRRPEAFHFVNRGCLSPPVSPSPLPSTPEGLPQAAIPISHNPQLREPRGATPPGLLTCCPNPGGDKHPRLTKYKASGLTPPPTFNIPHYKAITHTHKAGCAVSGSRPLRCAHAVPDGSRRR